MILGRSTEAYTWYYLVLSLIGLVLATVVMFGMLRAARLDIWTMLFLVATVFIGVIGVFFHSVAFGAPHVRDVISLVALTVAILAGRSVGFPPGVFAADDVRSGGIKHVASAGFDHHLLDPSATTRVKE